MYVYYDYIDSDCSNFIKTRLSISIYMSINVFDKFVYILCLFFLFYDVKKTGNKSRNRDYRANNLVGELSDSKKNCDESKG